MASSSSSSSPDFSRPCPENGCYDVFLNFRGKDTRYGFTSNLYHSLMDNQVHTFMDVKHVGKTINSLFNVIEKSKISVVVYSEKFASSHWCLKELDMILELMKEEKMVMLPIFYKVKVDELKHLTGNTGKYLEELISEHGEDNVNKWKTAVTTLGTISGLSFGDSYERVFIAEVIKTVKDMLEEWEGTIGSTIKPHSSGPSIELDNNKLDKKKESTRNEQVRHVSAIEENTQALADEVPQEDKCSSTRDEKVIYRIVTTAYFQKSNTYTPGELILFNPSFLIFYVELEKPSSSWLTLTNKTDKHVAFMLKMDIEYQPSYSINPNTGVLLPRSKCQVQVTMKAQSVLPSVHGEISKDKFLIESVIVHEHSYSMNDFSNLFRRMLSRFPIEKLIASVLYFPVLPRRDSSVPNHLGQLLANKGLLHGCMLMHSIDLHPTKPWLLLAFHSGFVSIWNYKTRVEEKSFRFDDWGLGYAKFIHEKHWIVVGGNNKGFVLVFNYNTSAKVKEFKAHEDSLRYFKVHPTSPYVLTTSCDKLIKLWNWENDWACSETFEGHSNHVMDVAFNPKDSRSFASASQDGTIKIWSFDSSVAKFTINAHVRALLTCVEYFVGNNNKLYLLCGSFNNTVRVWDYASKTLVQTLEGHSEVVRTTLVHPKLPMIITGSDDKTIRIWNKDTHRLKLVWTCDLGKVYSIGFIQDSDEVVLGCKDGMAVIKIVNAAGTRSD